MNGFDNEYRELFLPLMSFNRMPHAVIISGGNEKSRKEAADYLAMWAVCSEQEDSKPCGHCNSCRKASSGIHPDIFIPVPENKSKTISIKNLRDDIIPQFYIKPNDSSVRVFIFSEADTILREDTQNTLLKSIEEPPQDLLFIFTAEKADSLLSTIRSRAQSVSLTAKTETPEEIKNLAREITDSIVAVNEYNLLFACEKLQSKEMIKQVIPLVAEYLSLSLGVSLGRKNTDETANTIGRKIPRLRIINLINACDDIIIKSGTNINLNILKTYICSQLRRTAWQK